MMADHFELSHDSRGVATLTLDRPASRNALDEPLIAGLHQAIDGLAGDPAVRVVVLAAKGSVFCAGADLGWMQRAAASSADENLADARRFAAMMQAVALCPKPVVACVQGPAYGGGVGLICAADIAIASDRVHLTLSEARLGLLPAVIGPYLAEAVGARQARRLALTGERVDGPEALALGLVHKVVAHADLGSALTAVLDQLLAGAPGAHAATKTLFGALAGRPRDADVLELCARAISTRRATPEAAEGFAAFLAKRPPAWTPGTR